MSLLKLNVLVADDSRSVHSVFTEIAAASPIPVELIHADNGRDCARILATGQISVAFIDVAMPEMNGMDAVDAVRRAGNKTFITLMSATANKVRLQLARQLKVYEFLAKPFSATDVHAILQTYCRVTVPSEALVVDDSATVRRVIRRVFDDSIFNIRTTEAGDGETALAYAGSCRYDVVFLDCNMPGLNGLDTLERLIARDPDVKVIMISAERSGAWRRAALDRGACSVLGKPFSPADIDRELHSVFGLRMSGLADVPPLKLAATGASASAINENTWVNAAEAPHSPRRFSNADKRPGRVVPAGAASSDS